MILLFSYGSLRPGYWNAARYIECHKITPLFKAKTVDNFKLYIQHGGVPCAVLGGDSPLIGDVWQLPDYVADRIHLLESGYIKSNIVITNDAGREFIATIYHCRRNEDSPYHSRLDFVEPSGDFTKAVGPGGERLKTC